MDLLRMLAEGIFGGQQKGAAKLLPAKIQLFDQIKPQAKRRPVQVQGMTRDNQITNRMVQSGQLPASQAEIYPQGMNPYQGAGDPYAREAITQGLLRPPQISGVQLQGGMGAPTADFRLQPTPQVNPTQGSADPWRTRNPQGGNFDPFNF